jgi:outer membrane receptor protein involved in Fe transport
VKEAKMNPAPSNRFGSTLAGRPFRVAILTTALFSPLAIGASTDAVELKDLALEDLLRVDVVSASLFLQSITEAPATVTVIGEQELRQRGYRDLAEALVTMPGVYSSNDRNYTSLGVRGFNRPGDYGSRILLLTDGARRNDPVFDQALFGNEAPIEMDWVKHLEFVSGPASAVYGSNALFGTVNAVMLGGGDINGSRITLETGTHNTKRLGLVAGKKLDGDREWFLGFSAYKANGGDLYFPEFDNGVTDGRAKGLDGEGYQKAYAKFRWGNWRLTGNYSARKKDVPTAWYDTSFGEKGTWVRDESDLIDLRYDGDDNKAWQPSFRVFAGRYRFDGAYRYAPGPDAKDHSAADWLGSEFHLAYTDIPRHRLLFGIDTQWNTRVEQRYFEIDPRNDILNTNNPSRRVSLFAQDEWRFQPDWLLNVGLRQDRNRDFAAVTSPRVALIWQATQRLSLKAMTGNAYRVPNAYERFYNDGGVSQLGNANLRPEYVSSTELAAAYRFGQSGRVGLSLYRNQMRDLIGPAADSSGVVSYANQNRVNAHGVEIDAENQWSGGYRLRGSIAWQQSRLENGATLVDSPKWMGKLVFGVPVAWGWTASGEWLGLSSRRGDNGPVPGYGIVNLSLSSAPSARLGQFSATIYNVGNRRYFDPTSTSLIQSAIQQDGQQFRLSWTLAL